MSNYGSRSNNDAGRAPFPANNRQIPNSIRANGANTIFCYGCSQTKSRLAFSETQLKKASTRNPDKKHHIMCKQCTPTQPTSLKCVRCAKTQPMDNFSKTQRKNGNNATCMDCREYLNNDDSEEEFDIASDPEYYDGDMKDIL